ncbi:MAG: hypothetical protein FD146_640 [Anaerolineaceae bacterium]|nr:MAG: hypothetical protein FD146_640 [Anaerolineaceae bacterium]
MSEDRKKLSWLERPLSASIPWLTNELVLFGLIVLLAIVSRLYNLGARVMSHDESLHTYFSWLLYQGGGYQHNPMMHGPLQFHLLALTYFLFGATDFTARLPHAIASILTVVMLWKWRRYLGRPGTIIAAALVLISPYLLYYGRYARNEAFVGLFGVLTLYAILRYLETGKAKYLYLLTLATVLHFTSKETAFIYTAQALLFLVIYFIGRVTRKPWDNTGLFAAFIIVLSVSLLLLGAAGGLALLGRESEALNAAQTAAPPIPGQAVSPFAPVQTGPSLPVLLAAGAALALAAAGILLIIGYGWKALRSERSFDMLMLLGTFVLPQLVAFPIKALGWNPLDYTFQTTIPLWTAIKTGLFKEYFAEFIQQGMARTGIVLALVLILSAALGLWWNKKQWLLNAAIWYVLFTLFYTTFFTNGDGFFTGMVGSLGYWLEQQGVNRGSQPWYYYLLIQVPIYEFLPALGLWLALTFGLRRKSPAPLPAPADGPAPGPDPQPAAPESEGNHTFILLFWWTLSSALAFTIAGEKMPWLTYHITLPMLLITGWALGQLVKRMDWEEFRQKRGALLTGLVVIFLTGLGALLYNLLGSNPPFQGKELAHLSATTSFLFSVLAVAGSLAGITFIFLDRQWHWKNVLRLATLGLFALLAVLTARAAIRAAYIHADDGTEYLVYAHGARGIKDVMTQVEEISRRTAGETNIIVAYDVSAPDTGVSWPFTWYLRGYPNTRPFDQPTRSLREASIIIVDQKNFDKILPVVGDAYYRFDYLRMVWPNQDYFSLSYSRDPEIPFADTYPCTGIMGIFRLGKSTDFSPLCQAVTNRELRAGIFDIWLNRDFTRYAQAKQVQSNNAFFNTEAYTLAGWEPSDKMRLYIRKDVAAQIWNYGVGPSSAVQADPYEQGMTTLEADLVFGAFGQADGQLSDPHGIAIAPDGSIYVADTNNSRIVHFSADGAFLNAWGTFADATLGPVSLTSLNQPWGVAVSPDGQWVYVTDTWNHRVIKYTSGGAPSRTWGFSQYGGQDPFGLWGPRAIAVDASGNVFVADTGNKRIVAYDPDGNYLGQIGSEGMEPGQFSEPVGLAFDGQGNLFVADTWNQRIQSFVLFANPDGTLTFASLAQWDITGWYGQSLESKPYLAVDSLGHVFVTDPELGRVLEFTSTGGFVRGWGGTGFGSGQIGLASGIAVDSQGRVWVCDALNARLMRFTLP